MGPSFRRRSAMASGLQHDRATTWLALPWGLGWGLVMGPTDGLVAAGAFLLGGLWLSPDLDLPSRPTKRWGPLALLWWPYRRLLRHRSLLSHSPLLGTAGRLSYLALAVLGVTLVLHPLGGPSPTTLAKASVQLWQQQRSLLLLGLASVEASSWLHLLQDGDPLPRWPWRRRRQRQRQRQRQRNRHRQRGRR